MFAVHHLDLSQSTRVTDGQMDRQTGGQNYDSQDRPRICSRGKKPSSHTAAPQSAAQLPSASEGPWARAPVAPLAPP